MENKYKIINNHLFNLIRFKKELGEFVFTVYKREYILDLKKSLVVLMV